MTLKGMKLGEFVRGLRLEKGLTFCQLAEKCRVSPEVLIQIENGECKRPERLVLMRLARVFDTSFSSFALLAGYTEDEEDAFPFRDNRWKNM